MTCWWKTWRRLSTWSTLTRCSISQENTKWCSIWPSVILRCFRGSFWVSWWTSEELTLTLKISKRYLRWPPLGKWKMFRDLQRGYWLLIDSFQEPLKKCLPFFIVLRGAKDFMWTKECTETITQLNQYLSTPLLLSKLVCRKILFRYLAASKIAVSVALIREERTSQLPVYYVNKAMVQAKKQLKNES